MRLVVGGDRSGLPLKEVLVEQLRAWGHEVTDIGMHGSEEAPDLVDFPDIARRLCAVLLRGEAERGVMVCGTGVGAAIAANKVPGVRAAVCHDVYSAHQSVEHDDVRVLCLGAQIVGDKLAADLLTAFLGATFSTDEVFRRRVAKLHEMDQRVATPL